MKKIIKSICIILSTLSIASCTKDRITGNGTITTQQRSLSNFAKVKLDGASDVFIKQGSTYSVEVKAYSNLLPFIETNVTGDVLIIKNRSNTILRNDNTQVFITMPVLNGLFVNGAGNINTSGNFAANTTFTIDVSGAGDIYFAEGSTDNFYATISGTGDVNAFGLNSKNAIVKVSGVGHLELSVSDNLNVTISGVGDVGYKGNPAIIKQITGIGKLSKR
jgi:Putative auto-transporter adhesin, head GIN domain